MAEANHPYLTPEHLTEQRRSRVWLALCGRGVTDPRAVYASDRLEGTAWLSDGLVSYTLDGVPLVHFWPDRGTYQILYE